MCLLSKAIHPDFPQTLPVECPHISFTAEHSSTRRVEREVEREGRSVSAFALPPPSDFFRQSSAKSLLLALRCRALLVRTIARPGRLQPRPRALALALLLTVTRPRQRRVADRRGGNRRRRRASDGVALRELGQKRVQILLLRLQVV